MINKVILVGNLGNDPDFKIMQSGESLCILKVATHEHLNGKDYTEWHKVACWSKLANLCNQYLKKGSRVYVEGKLRTTSYEKDGITNYITEVVANNVVFLDRKDNKLEE